MKKVIVNGTFDILHTGHLKLLRTAKALGDFVLVAIDSDELVKTAKGAGRPINNQTTRKEVLESLKFVDEVFIFRSQTELSRLCRGKKFDIMLKGSDYVGQPITGAESCGSVLFIENTDDSTTKAIQRASIGGYLYGSLHDITAASQG